MAIAMTRYLFAACIALAACAAAPGDAKEVTYLCDGGRLATVTFSGDRASVRLANDSFELRHERAASGARYSGPRAALHTKGGEALLTIDGRQVGPCDEVKPKAGS